MIEEDYPYMDTWSDIHLEVYCMLNHDYSHKKEPFDYLYVEGKEPDEWPEVPNKAYDPEAKPEDWPADCKRKITIDCLECEHVAYCEMEVIKIEEEL